MNSCQHCFYIATLKFIYLDNGFNLLHCQEAVNFKVILIARGFFNLVGLLAIKNKYICKEENILQNVHSCLMGNAVPPYHSLVM